LQVRYSICSAFHFSSDCFIFSLLFLGFPSQGGDSFKIRFLSRFLSFSV
jgi:hypothetical protein